MDGIVNVLKPPGMTSFDVVADLRRIYGQKRIGHGGTLDPLAAGVLPVFLGRAAGLIEYMPLHTKTYEAEFLMGLETDTEDVSGQILSRGEPVADAAIWEAAAKRFLGTIEQVPSRYSAKKVNGRRAYDLARQGETFALPAKTIEIHELLIREVAPPYLRLSVTCSSGTYVRALGRDLGRAVGSPLTMSFLTRTKLGPFLISEARTIEEIREQPEEAVLSPQAFLTDVTAVELGEREAARFLLGQRLSRRGAADGMAAVSCGARFLGMGTVAGGVLHPKKVWN